MVRHSDADDVEEDEADDEDEEEDPRPRHRREPSRRHSRPGRPKPVRRWRASKEDADDSPDEEDAKEPRPPVFWRARDSLYFAPLVALALVVLIIVSLYAFTGNWPPVYVVESESMQHGTSDVLGLINTGDLVLAQRVSTGNIQTYEGAQYSGYQTYGEYGDVVLYAQNGGGGTPIIHRAIIYLTWDSRVGGYNATGLNPSLPCGNAPNAIYSTPGTPAGGGIPANCGVTGLTSTLNLYRIGWMSVNVSIDLSSPGLGRHSGFVTMGDNNLICQGVGNCIGITDQSGGVSAELSQLVEPTWVIGVARGMIPWFGAIKLLIENQNTGEVPAQSWQFMGLTVAGLILLAAGLHFALRAEGVEDPRRKAEEEEDEEDDDGPSVHESRARRLLRSLRPWGEPEESDDDDLDESPHPRKPQHHATRRGTGRRGRPRPLVRRGSASKKARADDEEDDL